MHESIVFCSACTMSSQRKFTFAILSSDEFLVDLSKAISLKWCKIQGKLVLMTNRK